jgi:hypothetical protein
LNIRFGDRTAIHKHLSIFDSDPIPRQTNDAFSEIISFGCCLRLLFESAAG